MEIDDELKDLVKQAKELSEVEDKSSSEKNGRMTG